MRGVASPHYDHRELAGVGGGVGQFANTAQMGRAARSGGQLVTRGRTDEDPQGSRELAGRASR